MDFFGLPYMHVGFFLVVSKNERFLSQANNPSNGWLPWAAYVFRASQNAISLPNRSKTIKHMRMVCKALEMDSFKPRRVLAQKVPLPSKCS